MKKQIENKLDKLYDNLNKALNKLEKLQQKFEPEYHTIISEIASLGFEITRIKEELCKITMGRQVNGYDDTKTQKTITKR